MSTKEALFETAKKLMELQQLFAQQVVALQCDETVEKAEAHMLVDNAINLCSKHFETLKAENKAFLDERVERGDYTYTNQYIAGVQVEGKSYTAVGVKGYELLNKEDPKVWMHVLASAAKWCPDAIQKRITDSKVTEKFLEECAGLIAVKTSDDYNWSIKKAK